MQGAYPCILVQGYAPLPTYRTWEDEYRYSSRMREEYSNYLQSLHWDYIITITFRKVWRNSIYTKDSVWEFLHGECYVARAFLAVERNPGSFPNLHVHGLVSDYTGKYLPRMLLPWGMWEGCFHRFGRSEVAPVRSPAAVSAYCSKYVTKRMADYGFYGQARFWDK